MATRTDTADTRLDTWKEISAFLRCDERTAKRWEADRDLPVHRLPGGGRSKVFAYASELSRWLDGAGAASLGSDQTDIVDAPADLSVTTPEPAARDRDRRPRMRHVLAGVGAGILLLGGATAVLAPKLHAASEAQVQAPPTGSGRATDPVAVSLYLGGVHDWNTRTPAGLTRAVDEFTQAIVRDPGYAPAYVGLANCYNLLREYTLMSPQEAYPRAKAAAERAIALDDRLAGGHSALAFVEAYWSWNDPVADREFRRAIQLDPGSAQAHHWYATFLLHLNRPADALREIGTAQGLDPNSSAILADKAAILARTGRVDEAVQSLRQMEHTDPDLLSPHRYLSQIYLGQGDFHAYLDELHKYAVLLNDPISLDLWSAGVRGAATGGRQGMLAAMLRRRLAFYAEGRVTAFDVAENQAQVGDRGEALKYLKVAIDRRDEGVADLRTGGGFNRWGGDPEMAQLLAAAGHPKA